MNTKQDTSKLEPNYNQCQSATCESLPISLDVHAGFIMAAWQMDGSKPKPPQKFLPEVFLQWIARQLQGCKKVSCCYEAGPTGFWLHRKLVARGVTNLVVCPTCLDSRRSEE